MQGYFYKYRLITVTTLMGLLLSGSTSLAKTKSDIFSNPSSDVPSSEPALSNSQRSIGPWSYNGGNSSAAKFLPDISVMGNFTGGYFSTDPVGDVGHDPARTGFTLQEIELALQSNVDPYFRAAVFLGFHEAGVEIEEAYASSSPLKGLTLHTGKFLMPFGRQNQKHLHIWSFADSMLINKTLFGAEGFSELGVSADYLLPLPFFLEAQAVFANGDNEISFNGTRKQDFVYSGRLSTSVDLSSSLTVLLGGSVASGFNDSAAGRSTQVYGGDILFKWKKSTRTSLTWQSEYMLRSRDTPGLKQNDGGLYSYLDLQFAKRWHVAARFDFVGLPDDATVREWRATPALTFQPTEFSQLRLQYEYDHPDGTDAIHAAVLQLQFAFGAHAAHAY